MKLANLPSEFQKALPILSQIKAAGYEAYFVGGSVRDSLLGRPIHDVDIATSAYPEEIKTIFPRTIDVGIEHGTVLVLDKEGEYEVTTFRTEDVYVDFRRPSSVSFVRSLAEDLKRRDFTVNAFAVDETGQVTDLFDGLTDLNNRCLRAVGVPAERFQEDALRIMRGFRFAASLDFQLDEATFEAMAEHASLLTKISIERIFIEFDKLLMAPSWKSGLFSLIESRAFLYLPDLAEQENGLRKLLTNLQPQFTFSSSEQAWAALFLALENIDAKAFLRKWKTSNDFQKAVSQLIAAYKARLTSPVTKELVYTYGKDCLLSVEELRTATELDDQSEQVLLLDSQLPIHSKKDMVINGGDLIRDFGVKPGPQMGEILDELERLIVAGELENEIGTIKKWMKRSDVNGERNDRTTN